MYWSRRPVRSRYSGVRAPHVSIIHHTEGVALLTTEPEDVGLKSMWSPTAVAICWVLYPVGLTFPRKGST